MLRVMKKTNSFYSSPKCNYIQPNIFYSMSTQKTPCPETLALSSNIIDLY